MNSPDSIVNLLSLYSLKLDGPDLVYHPLILPVPTATQPRRCSRVRDLRSKLPLPVSRVAPRSLPTSAERLHHRLVHADRWVHADLSWAPCRRGSHRRPASHSARAVATPPSPHSALPSAVFRISLGSSSGGSSRRK
jgi:hypothetical protein